MEKVAGRGWTVTGGLPACSPEATVRWGGFALVAGTLGIVCRLCPCCWPSASCPTNALYDLPGPVGALLVAAGLGGVYSLLGGKRRRLARTGLVLAFSSVVLTAVPGLYLALTQPPPFPAVCPRGLPSPRRAPSRLRWERSRAS